MTATKDTTPVVLSGSAVNLIAAGAVGPAVTLPSAGLVNLLSDPIEISDLIVTSQVRAVGIGATAPPYPAVLIMLKAGRHGLTNGFVPVVSLGIALDIPLPSLLFLADGVTTLQTYMTRWLFPRPMILRPGEAISGALALSPLDTYTAITGSVTTTVAARGRRIPASSVPRISPYPFNSGAYYPVTAGAPIPNLPPQSLTHQNIFPVPLNVAAIICNYAAILGVSSVMSIGGNLLITGPGGDSGGARRTIAEGAVNLVFGQRRGMEVPFILAPNESLAIKFTSVTVPVPVLPAVAIMGYREEAA